MNVCAYSYVVAWKPRRIEKKVTITNALGINAAKDSMTAGGTPSGNFMIHPLLCTQENIFTEINAVIIAKKIPYEPKLPNENPPNALPASFT